MLCDPDSDGEAGDDSWFYGTALVRLYSVYVRREGQGRYCSVSREEGYFNGFCRTGGICWVDENGMDG